MAKSEGPAGSKLRGQIGPIIYQVRYNKALAYEAPVPSSVVRHSLKQTIRRMHVAVVARTWRCLSDAIAGLFERAKPEARDYNMFLKCNVDRVRVYPTKEQNEKHLVVLDNYQISSGSLPNAIEVKEEGDLWVSNLAVGQLAVDGNTRLIDLANAVIANGNGLFEKGDSIRFVRAWQSQFFDESTPTVKSEMTELTLETDPARAGGATVWGLTGGMGFSTVEGVDEEGTVCNYLAFRKKEGEMVAWVQRRRTKDGRWLCGNQQLVGENALLADFTSEWTEYEALQSYEWKSAQEFLKKHKGYIPHYPPLPGIPQEG